MNDTVAQFEKWLASATIQSPPYIYHTGRYAAENAILARAVFKAAVAGKLFLFQTVAGLDRDGKHRLFNYQAKRISAEAGQALKPAPMERY